MKIAEINTEEDIEIYQDTKFEKSIKCRSIICKGKMWNITARDITSWDITAKNITAMDITAMDITAWNITAWDIICEKRIKKDKSNKTISRVFIQNKSAIEKKEQLEEKK